MLLCAVGFLIMKKVKIRKLLRLRTGMKTHRTLYFNLIWIYNMYFGVCTECGVAIRRVQMGVNNVM